MVSTNYQGLFISKKGNVFVDKYEAEIIREANEEAAFSAVTAAATPLVEKAKARKAKAIAATEAKTEEA